MPMTPTLARVTARQRSRPRRAGVRSRAAALGAALLAVPMLQVAAVAAPPEAVITGGEAFFRSSIVEVGARANGSFGSTGDAPDVTWHPRHQAGSRQIGFRYNRGGAADWSGVTDGDFFLPGAEYEAWAIQVGSNAPRTNSNSLDGVAGAFSATTIDADGFVGVRWTATAPVDGIDIEQVYRVQKAGTDPRVYIDVSLTNTTGGSLNVYYLRSVDADNCAAAVEFEEEPCFSSSIDGGYGTRQVVAMQRLAGDVESLVTASDDDGSVLGLGSTAPQSLALYDSGFCESGFDWPGIIDEAVSASQVPTGVIPDDDCEGLTAEKDVPLEIDATMHVIVKVTIPAGGTAEFFVFYDLAGAAPVAAASTSVPPVLTCSPVPAVPGGTLTCEVTGGDPDIDMLWRAAFDGSVFASRGVRLGPDGVGSFSFTVPRGAACGTITVELVEWLPPMTIEVACAAVPTRLPAGEGGVPGSLVVLGVLTLAGAGALVRRMGVAAS
jgi:hypothetical protein